jgi:hypothetical protein
MRDRFKFLLFAKAMPCRILLVSLINVLVLQNATATLFFSNQFGYTDGANHGHSLNTGFAEISYNYAESHG